MALEPRLAAYIAARMPGARDVAVQDLSRISGGASRETYRFRLLWNEDGAARERKLILRRDPPASLFATERRIEFEAYHFDNLDYLYGMAERRSLRRIA